MLADVAWPALGDKWEGDGSFCPSALLWQISMGQFNTPGKVFWQSQDCQTSMYYRQRVRNMTNKGLLLLRDKDQVGHGFQQLPAAGEKFLIRTLVVWRKRT